MPGSNSTNATTTNAIGTVEHAFASVRLVEANVCAGGTWLTDSKDDVQVCRCEAEDRCGERCINRAMRYECQLERCPCRERCSNRQLQVGSTLMTAVIHCGRKGVGVIALEDVDVGRLVGEYVGEVLTRSEAKLRFRIYGANTHFYMLQLGNDRVIDATRIGGRMRFLNHSCEPNCSFEKWNVRGEERCGVFCIRRVQAGNELTVQYGLRYIHSAVR
ncbi:hypothetical protein DVH05_020328 [Phytophthora capsici]|nr:hypothetical protein DVH05_020328 [Phytophthora capsici]